MKCKKCESKNVEYNSYDKPQCNDYGAEVKKGEESKRYVPVDYIIQTKSKGIVPVGTVLVFTGETIPEGFIKADGNVYKIETYPELAKVLGGGSLGEWYRKHVWRWWIFRWIWYKRVSLIEEYGIFQVPKMWRAQYTAHPLERDFNKK